MPALIEILSRRRWAKVPVVGFVLVSLVIAPLQEQAPDPTEPAKTAAADNAAQVQTRIRELEGAANLDEQKAKLLEVYRQIQVRISEIRMLEEELPGTAARAELIAANRDLITRQIPQTEARIQRLENPISQARQEEAGRARLEAQRLRREAIGKHPIIQSLAGEITKLTEETHSLGPLIDAVQKQRAAVESESIEIGADLEEARKTLGETAISDSMGAILLDHRQRLPRARRFEKDRGERMERVSNARLRLFKLDRQLNELNDPKRVVAKLLEESTDVPEGADQEGLAAEVETLVIREREETQRLTGLYRSYLEELDKLEAAQADLSQNSKEFSDLLDEHLLWIRNAETVGKDTLVSLPLALRWLIDPANWSFLPPVLLNALTPLYALALLGAILIVVLRGRLQARLIDMASSVGKVRLDGLGPTLRGLLITIVLATPFSIITGVLALRINAGGPIGSEFSKSIAFGLAAAALVAFAAQLARSVCRPSGIGELHFRWNKENTKLIRNSLSWFVCIAGVGIVVGFNLIGIGWSSVQWLVAALTVGLGFGLQEIFANFVSGLIILLERPVRVGDTVTVGTISGVVTRIRMRATTITDWNRKELIVPTKTFITAELINWSLSDPVLRLDFPVGIAYGSDTTLAHRVILKVAKDHPLVMKQPEPNVFFLGFGDNSLSFDVRVFVQESTNTGRTRILHDLHMAIDRTCREHDIVIAFPQRDLHLKTADAVIRVAQVSVEPAPKGLEPGTT